MAHACLLLPVRRRLQGISLDEACAMTLSELVVWVEGVPKACRKKCVPWPKYL